MKMQIEPAFSVKNAVANVVASMAMEGMFCTEDETEMLEQIVKGRITIDEAMEMIDKECEEIDAN